jgi:carbon storage regulator CsrA
MLVLTRKVQEQIQIGDNVTITILRMKGRAVRVGIDAPKEVRICRGELPRGTTPPAVAWEVGEGKNDSSYSGVGDHAESDPSAPGLPGSTRPDRGGHRLPPSPGRASRGPLPPQARGGRCTAGPLLAIATRRLRRRRAQFIPEGRI